MSASGLIYAAIALMWAAVLIPMWLRNHDTASENRSVERFGQAMRVLSRREQERRRPDAATPSAAPANQTAGDRAPVRREARPRPTRQAPARRPRTLVQRRARTLGVLAILTLLLVVAAPLSAVPWWAPLPLLALLVGFVVHLRVQALQKQRRRRPTVRPQAGSTAHGEPTAPERSGFVSGPSRAVTVETKGRTNSARDGQDRPTVDADVATAAPAASSDGGWDPNPLPLPTYVTAPKAVRPIKVIDLTTPGAFSSGRLLDDGLGEEDLLAAEVAADELDALLEHEAAPPTPSSGSVDVEPDRRAVGD